MSEPPYFSILIPTKNRSHLIGYAVRSVLSQRFSDFEIVVCDNDDDHLRTKIALESLIRDGRVRYVRSGGLSMVENWNMALSCAKGKYVTVLEDKMIFYPDALREIQEEVMKSPTGVLVWKTDIIDDTDTPAKLIKYNSTNEVREVSSESILSWFTADVMQNLQYLPRGLSSVIPMGKITMLQTLNLGTFYEAFSPDITSGLKILATTDQVTVLDRSLTLVTSEQVSNGRKTRLRLEGNKYHSYYGGKSRVEHWCSHVPVDSLQIVTNNIVNDYRGISEKYGGRLLSYPISHKKYVKMMTRECVATAVKEKRILWTKREIRQLITSSNAVFRNLFYIGSQTLRMIHNYVRRNLFRSPDGAKMNATPIQGPIEDFIEQLVAGDRRRSRQNN